MLFAAALICFCGASARADYDLASGDSLEIVVYGVPELSRNVTVGLDGTVAFPPLGLIDVTGLGPAEVAARLGQQLVEAEILDVPQVTVALTAARPVLVGGDVAMPGAYPYAANLTVRGAIALAGGLGMGRDRALDEAASLRSERELVEIEIFREQAHRARLAALLAESTELGVEPGPGAAPDHKAILALEAERLRADAAEAAAEKAHLGRAVALVETRIKTLIEQQEIQHTLLEQQTAQVDRILEIRNRGLASEARVEEERRVFQAMQERAAANAAEIASAQGELESATHAMSRFDARRRTALEDELKETMLGLGTLEARRRGLDARLAQVGLVAPDFLVVTIYRAEGTGEVALPAEAGTALAPGDTLEVRIALPAADLSAPAAPAATAP